MAVTIDYQGHVGHQRDVYPEAGTCLQGCVDVSYQRLVEVFGRPNYPGDPYKMDAGWLIYSPDGVATIYNYKDGKQYLGAEGQNVADITDWHIGAHTWRPVVWVRHALGLGDDAQHSPPLA